MSSVIDNREDSHDGREENLTMAARTLTPIARKYSRQSREALTIVAYVVSAVRVRARVSSSCFERYLARVESVNTRMLATLLACDSRVSRE